MRPADYVLRVRQGGVGDTVAVSAFVRDFALAYPDRTLAVAGPVAREVFRYDTRVCEEGPDSIPVVVDYRGTVDRAVGDPQARYLAAAYECFLATIGNAVPLTDPRPELILDPATPGPPVPTPYYVLSAGTKPDMPAKQWPPAYFEELVRAVGGTWYQAGLVRDHRFPHFQPRIPGALDLVGGTDVQDLFRLIAHAAGVVCHLSLATLVAAAFDTPCVTLAGGRENPWLYEGLGVEYLHTLGQLPCCVTHGCQVCVVRPGHAASAFPHGYACVDPVVVQDVDVGRCLALITPAQAAAALEEAQLRARPRRR